MISAAVITRKEAQAAGLLLYFTGKPCNLGMVAERDVKEKKCQCDAHRAARAGSARRRYLEQRPERIAKARDYAQQNAERVAAKRREHYAQHRDEYKARAADWNAANSERRKQVAREWAARNPATVGANTRMRLARLSAASKWFGEFDRFVMQEAFALAKLRKAATGIKWEVDHVVPIAGRGVCGLHIGRNIQVIPMTANRRKSNSHAVALRA